MKCERKMSTRGESINKNRFNQKKKKRYKIFHQISTEKATIVFEEFLKRSKKKIK